jgi:hypothetical protein
MGGLDGPPKPPLRSERPGEAVALLESLGYLGDFEEAAQFD